MSVRSLSLNTKLVASCMIMLGFSLVLSIGLISVFGDYYVRADRDVASLTVFKGVLRAASQVAAERGPMNVVLGNDQDTSGQARQQLVEARKATDDAIADILAPGGSSADLTNDTTISWAIQRTVQSLSLARADADRLAATPRADRHAADIAVVLQEMFDAADLTRPLMQATIARLTTEDEALAGPVLIADMLTEVRDYAGRLGSDIFPYVLARRPLDEATLLEVARTRARLVEIWQLAGRQGGLFGNDPGLAALRSAVNTGFFGPGFELIDNAMASGGKTGDYGMTVSELSDAYIAMMKPIEQFRAAFLEAALDRVVGQRQTALMWLSVVTGGALLIVATTLALIGGVRHYLLRPLMLASNAIVALSDGILIYPVKCPTRSKEMRRLFDALEGLRITFSHREQHTEKLKVLSETDALTGLINRRLFDRIGQGDPEFASLDREASVIMMDLDRFKCINDTYGHLVGDLVLKHAAAIVQRVCRKSDVVARYGGEEIAIVVFEADAWGAVHVAERIRLEIEAEPVVLPDGRTINITASFGVAHGFRGNASWLTLVKSADGALYQAKSSGRNRVCRSGGSTKPLVRHVA